MATLQRNRIKPVDRIKREIAMGMPDGMSQDFLKQIPWLTQRIEELEKALHPFARVVQTNKGTEELIHVYRADCERAFAMLDPNNSTDIKKPLPEYPA